MVKQNPKEKLNNKAAKMIDLILDEVYSGGEKSITASFKDSRYENKIYSLTVGLIVEYIDSNTTDIPNNTINPSTQTDLSPSINPLMQDDDL